MKKQLNMTVKFHRSSIHLHPKRPIKNYFASRFDHLQKIAVVLTNQ